MSDRASSFARVRTTTDLQRRLDDSDRRQQQRDQADLVADGDRRLILRSPNGHYWQVTVGDDGTLATTDLGTQAP